MKHPFRTFRLFALGAAFAFAALAGPAVAQDDAAVEPAAEPAIEPAFDMERLKPWAEIEALAWPLMAAAAPTCADPTWRTGIEVLGSPGQGVFVRSVGAGSPADGLLQVGDTLVAFDGKRFPGGVAGYEEWERNMAEDAAHSDAAQRWTVVRDGTEQDVTLQPVEACHVQIAYVTGNVAAVLRREQVLMFTPALFELAPEPWMVQAQVAHYLGHRKEQHEAKNARKQRFWAVAGNVMGALGGPNVGAAGQALTLRGRPKQEVEADQAGIDLAVGIGIDERDLIQYWVDVIDLEASAGAGATWLSGHPAHPSRIEALEERFAALQTDQVDQAGVVDAAEGTDEGAES